MTTTGRLGVGVPTVLLHEAEGFTVTIEGKDGTTYRGILHSSEDNMNCCLKNVTVTHPVTGETHHNDQTYLRGTQILFVRVPDMLEHCPMFKRVLVFKQSKGRIFPSGTLHGAAGGGAFGRNAQGHRPGGRM